jgi:flagellar motor component MotA
MILEGVIGIQSGLNPHYLREKLKVFLEEEIDLSKIREKGHYKKE